MDATREILRGAWWDAARQLEPSPLTLPAGPALSELLTRLGVQPDDRAELAPRIAEVAEDPLLSRIAARFVTAMRDEAGVLGIPSPYAEPRRAWPTLPLSLGPAARCVYLPGLLASVDRIREAHRSRGISDQTSWATLADLGRQLAIHRRVHGAVGVDTQWWLMLVWSGRLVDLGRLQGEWLDERTVGLHIPETGPLRPEAIDESLARIRNEWPAWFGARPQRAQCESWLLDPRLADVLPADSNIVRFQRRFVLYDGGYLDDRSPLYFVFRRREVPLPDGLAALPRDTTLRRAVLDHLAAGGHWTIRKGWLPL